MCLGACPQPSSSNFQNNQCQIKTRMLIPAKHFTQQKFISCKSKRVVFHTQLSVTTHPSITLKMVSINKHDSRSSRSCIVLTPACLKWHSLPYEQLPLVGLINLVPQFFTLCRIAAQGCQALHSVGHEGELLIL